MGSGSCICDTYCGIPAFPAGAPINGGRKGPCAETKLLLGFCCQFGSTAKFCDSWLAEILFPMTGGTIPIFPGKTGDGPFPTTELEAMAERSLLKENPAWLPLNGKFGNSPAFDIPCQDGVPMNCGDETGEGPLPADMIDGTAGGCPDD